MRRRLTMHSLLRRVRGGRRQLAFGQLRIDIVCVRWRRGD